jgi:hypothetical protein
MDPINIGFTGTRSGLTQKQKEALRSSLRSYRWAGYAPSEVICHHGDCVGADTDFHNICVELNYEIIIHPPINSSLRAFNKSPYILDPKSYLERNKCIVDNCDYLIACPLNNPVREETAKGGTWFTIKYAFKRRRGTTIILPSGEKTLHWY